MLLLLGHGEFTQKIISASRGEMANARKFWSLLSKFDYATHFQDILELFASNYEELHEFYISMGITNLELARAGQPIIHDIGMRHIRSKIHSFIEDINPEALFLFSWECSLGALFATGVQLRWPVISKLYVHKANEPIPVPLFEPSSLLITESLLGNKTAIEKGIPPWKVVFLPHCPLPEYSSKFGRPSYLNKMFGKKGDLKKGTLVIGLISRLIYGKNCEFAIDTVSRLVSEGFPVCLLLKGDFETKSLYPDYQTEFKEVIENIKHEKWFLWDPTYTPTDEMQEVYLTIDIFLHLSGHESGSNVIVEALSNQIPSIILECDTNDSLFKHAACFVKKQKKKTSQPFFTLPDREDLYQKLKFLLQNPKEREELSLKGLSLIQKRFSPSLITDRMPLILEAAKAYFNGNACTKIQKKIEDLYQQDCELFSFFS
jgi:glycosyltransferase involved in cell wall biosynthesis